MTSVSYHHEGISHTASTLFKSTGKNGCLNPKKPHQDYIPTECRRESPIPWGMIMALPLGGNCLNEWNNNDSEKYAMRPEIPFKLIFLMCGNIVHGGVLENF